MGAKGYCWSKTSERRVLRICYKYLEALLRQEVPTFFMHSTVFFSGLVFCTYFSWKLSLVALPLILLLVIPGFIYGKYLLYLFNKSYKEHNKSKHCGGTEI